MINGNNHNEKNGNLDESTAELSSSHQIIIEQDWLLIINKIIDVFNKKNVEKVLYGRFMHLLSKIRELKKEGLIQYSNSRLKNALEELIEIEFLQKKIDGSYKLAEDYKMNQEKYMKKIIAHQNEYFQ